MIAMPASPFAVPAALPDFAAARYHMVECQLRPNKVTDDRLIKAMGEAPREQFVPSTLTPIAYVDENIPLISGRFLMQPMVLARLLQAASIQAGDRVLDIAPGTGYSTLLLAMLGACVTALEPDALLHQQAEANLAPLVTAQAPGRVKVLAGAPVEGCIAGAPYDVILINGSVEFVPEVLLQQLTENGRLLCVMRHYGPAHAAHSGRARIYHKQKDAIDWQDLFDANLPLASGFQKKPGFRF